ncbi:MAG TPA: hypothetical protein VFS75_00385 [Candidatus Paceibacterota bacterium]|nr:hypothetical protein [Candidatus Paceibacterota bacterium]
MLYAYFGEDTAAVRNEAFRALRRMEKGALVTTVTADTWNAAALSDLAGGASLFGEAQVIVLDTISEGGADAKAELFERLDVLKGSSHNFILIEGSLKADEKKRLAKVAEEAKEMEGEKAERFNAFAMTDALLRKDKKSLWLLLTAAWREGLSNEEIIGVLFWQLKTLRLVAKAKDATDAGLKPFVYGKAKRALSSFTEKELDRLSLSLLSAYHDGHAGRADIATALEAWVLSL